MASSRRILLACAVLMCCSQSRAGSLCVRLEFLDPSGVEFVVRPVITIDDDGLVRWSESGLGEEHQARISDEHKTAVLGELVEALQLDEIDSREMWEEIVSEGSRTGLSPQIPGAGITRITVRLPEADEQSENEVVVECPACHLLATRYPEVESLQRFARCQAVLENLRAVMQLGGFDEAERLTEQANAFLQLQGRDDQPLTHRELSFVRRLPDGAKFVTFRRVAPSTCSLSAIIEPGRAPEFQIVD